MSGDNEMVTQVALAICEAERCPGTDPLYCARCLNRDRVSCITVARAAIAAMREPTEAMTLAGAKAAADQHYYKDNAWERCVDFHQDWLNGAKYGWRAMIDVILQ